MKRIFALALVLVMALGMMSMTASAAPITCPDHSLANGTCTAHTDEMHYYIYEITADNIVKYCWFYADNQEFADHDENPISYFTERGLTPTVGMLIWAEVEGGAVGVCKYPSAPAQPKTGVMDTLPLWFGIMAVSACAYILTSKKKVF